MAGPNAEPFTAMAARIEHNAGATFGGAVVIVPPANAGERIDLLMLDSQGDGAQFWATIKTRIELMLSKMDEQARVAAGFGRR